MGVSVDLQEGSRNGGHGPWSSLRFLVRRKQVDSAKKNFEGQLAKELSVPHLIAIGNPLWKVLFLFEFGGFDKSFAFLVLLGLKIHVYSLGNFLTYFYPALMI